MTPCSIVIPVYNAFADALMCLESVVRCTAATVRIVVVDDASTEGLFAEVLPASLRQDPRLVLIRQARNAGFVKSCNTGIHAAGTDDVVLLNSDTLVTPGWLQKLQSVAQSRPRVATVTPLTNNGTLASIPNAFVANAVPAGYTLDEFAALVEQVSRHERVELPTCVGFCVYIRREALQSVGLFDEVHFGRGYGEENDFSCRAQALGFVDLLDDSTYIFHRGQGSFGPEREALSRTHMATLLRLHPLYAARVEAFVRAHSLHPLQQRIHDEMFRRWLKAARQRVLHILHHPPLMRETTTASPGGVEYHVADLIGATPDTAGWSLYPRGDGFILTAHVPGVDLVWELSGPPARFLSVLEALGFTMLHLHQPSPYPSAFIRRLLFRHGYYVVSLHDYGLFCSTYHLMTTGGVPCDGLNCEGACHVRSAVAHDRISLVPEILRRAKAVLYFSEATRGQFEKRFKVDCKWVLMQHGLPPQMQAIRPGAMPGRPDTKQALRVLFLGGINRAKGADVVRRLARQERLTGGIPVEWHLVGLFDGEPGRRVRDHGRYFRSGLPAILAQIRPHLVAILSEGLETYCYTLDEALACGIPALVTPRGAPAERVRRHGAGWVASSLEVRDIIRQLGEIAEDWEGYVAVWKRVAEWRPLEMSRMGQAYLELYSAGAKRSARVAPDDLLDVLGLWQARHRRSSPWRRRVVRRVLETGVNLLERLRLRRTTARIAGRLIPLTALEQIERLRQDEVER